MTTDEKNYSVPALVKGLKILELFDEQYLELSVSDMAEMMNSTVSSIYRTIFTLEELGYLEKNDSKTYRLGGQVLMRGFSYLANNDIIDVAAPFLKKLSKVTTTTCHLGIRLGIEVVYQYRIQSKQQLVTNFPVGTRILAHRNAMGRVLLSRLPEEELRNLYANVMLDDLPKPEPQTLYELMVCLKEIKCNKHAFHSSHNSQAIAAPIVDYNKNIIAAINISGPDLKHDNTFRIKALLDCAQGVSQKFGGNVDLK